MHEQQVGNLADMRKSGGHWFIYLFFGIHMLMFGLSGFLMAYTSDGPDLAFVYLHGGIAIVVYMVFYLVIFGRDEVKWMLINAALGILGIYSQIGWILAKFGKDSDMGRPAQPEELSPAYVFLASPVMSSYVNGAILPVMGGPRG